MKATSSLLVGSKRNTQRDALCVQVPEPVPEPVESEQRLVFPLSGARIFFRQWQCGAAVGVGKVERLVVLFHRGHEHSARLRELATALCREEGVRVVAWDAPGGGLSGDGPSADVVDQPRVIDEFVRHVAAQAGVHLEQVAVVAHSMSAVTVGAWIQDFAPPIAGLVLAAPAFEIDLKVPGAWPALSLWHKVRPQSRVKSFVTGRHLTADAELAAAYDADPLIDRGIDLLALLDLKKMAQRVVENAHAIHVPVLLMTAGADVVVKSAAQQKFYDGVPAGLRHCVMFSGARHALFHDVRRSEVFEETANFLQRCFAPDGGLRKLSLPEAVASAVAKYSPVTSGQDQGAITRMMFGAQRLVLQTAGRLSGGIRQGWRTGFDSGASLDYVYRNEAQGTALIGKWIDRAYLDSPGWKGIRIRRQHMREALRETILAVHEARGGEVRILDVACGGGRYVIEALQEAEAGGMAVSADLRDNAAESLAAARALSEKLNLGGRVKIGQGDAFDADQLRNTFPRPDIAVVSGLYELISDNDLLQRSLNALASSIPPGGYLVYTNQPWHPQLEMIACVLSNRQGRRWVMRPRSQWEMDQLVAGAGFRKIHTRIDEEGIFSVTVAQRVEG